jgi:hypothetical protein
MFILLLSAMSPMFGQTARMAPGAFAAYTAETIQYPATIAVPHAEPGIGIVDPNIHANTAGVVVQEELIAGRKAETIVKEKFSLRERYNARAKRHKKL